jgi:hypothetical protein
MPIVPRESEQHRNLMELLNGFVRAGRESIAGRVEGWNRCEKNKKLYVNLKAKDKRRRDEDARSKDSTDPRQAGYLGTAPIVVPITFAMNMTSLSYLMSLYGARNPIIPLLPGGGSDDTEAAQKMEYVMSYQMSEIGYFLKLYLWLQDMIDYGIGVTFDFWNVKMNTVMVDANAQGMMGMLKRMGIPLPVKRVSQEVVGYEGNDCMVIDPYRLIIDSRRSLSDYQRGEFIGFDDIMSKHDLIMWSNDKQLSNVSEAKNFFNNHSKVTRSNSRTAGRTNQERSFRDKALKITRPNITVGAGEGLVTRLFVRLNPSEYQLEDYNQLCIYEFWVLDDSFIIYADRKKSYTNEFPLSIMEYSPDGHSLLNMGQSEILEGLQSHISWLFNSHMENVRKVLNDMLIVDPSRVNMNDLKDPEPGKLIRLRETAYGQDVRSIVHQLQVGDVTSGHMSHISSLMDLMQRIIGTNDNMMGFPNFGRRTATEVRSLNLMAGGRQKLLAELSYVQGVKPQHQRFISNTQQFLSQERFYRITGEIPYQGDGSNKLINVSPGDILGHFDLPTLDGVLPADRIAIAETWKEIFTGMANNQILMASGRYNMVGIFEHIARLLGAKDISKFINQPQPGGGLGQIMPQMMDDESLEGQVDAGNMVPLEELLGAAGGSNEQ